MNCEQIHPLLTQYLLHDLDSEQNAAVQEHLATCEACQAELQMLEPTLALLADALSEPVGSRHLTENRRERILHPGRTRQAIQWVGTHRPRLAVAAGLIFMVGTLWGLLMPATMRSRSRAHDLSIRIVEPEPVEALEDILEIDVELPEPPAPIELDLGSVATLPASDSAVPAPPQDVSVQPAEFDSVAMVKSPVIMKGIYGSRSPGARGAALQRFGGGIAGGEEKAALDPFADDDSGVSLDGDDDGDAAVDYFGAAFTSVDNSVRGEAREGIADEVAAPMLGDVATVGQLSEKGRDDQTELSVEQQGWHGRHLASAAKPASSRLSEETISGSLSAGKPLNQVAARRSGREDASDGRSDLLSDRSGDRLSRTEKMSVLQPSSRKKAQLCRKPTTEAGKEADFLALSASGAMVADAEQPAKQAAASAPGRVETRANMELGYRESLGERKDALKRELADLKKKQDAPMPADRRQYECHDSLLAEAATELELEENETVGTTVGRKLAPEEVNSRATFTASGVNLFQTVKEIPVSTFAIDVDTAAYTVGRNYMQQGQRPPAESVRTEEFVNFFDYAYKAPTRETFKVYTEVAPSKFGRGMHLMKIGIKGRRLGREEQRQASLTFLIDTSGSMNQSDRLGLVQKSLELLVNELNPKDRVAIVQYDSHARLVLEHTPASQKDVILKAMKRMQCGGSTNLEEGMHRAYSLAAANFVPKGENRVLLLSDGVANLGSGAAEDILAKIENYRRQGITCSVFGFGMGTYDDTMLETLANKGDGAYAFIDSEAEARRVFVDDLSATLNTIATDVKIQVEFDPTYVVRYRQLGYENRQLRKEDFRNDAIDAGEVGSGQSVTALYELELAAPAQLVMPSQVLHPRGGTLATVRVRYRRVDTGAVEEIDQRVQRRDVLPRFEATPPRFQLAAAVGEFAEILRGSPYAQGSSPDDVATVLRPVALELSLDRHVQELLRLVESADGMSQSR